MTCYYDSICSGASIVGFVVDGISGEGFLVEEGHFRGVFKFKFYPEGQE
jgi:hypothetical protein